MPDVPIVVFRDGVHDIGLSDALSRCAIEHPGSFKSAVRSAIARVMSLPGFFSTRGLPILVEGTAAARGFVEQMVRSFRGTLKPLKGGRPGFSVRFPRAMQHRGETMFQAMAMLIRMLKACCIYLGPDPLELENWHGLDEAQRACIAAEMRKTAPAARKFLRDVGRFYRFAFRLWIPVRTQDVRWFGRIREALRPAPVGVWVYVLVQATSGCRPGEPQWATLWDYLVAEAEFVIMLRNKGWGDEADKKGLLTHKVRAEEVDPYVDGRRRELDPKRRGLVYFRGLMALVVAGKRRGATKDDKAAATAAEAELRTAPLVLNDHGRRLTCRMVQHHCSRHFGDIPATPHWLRHEFVFNHLRLIDRILDEAEKKLKRSALAAYMGWSSAEEMLACYDAYEVNRKVLQTTLDHMDQLERDVGKLVSADAPAWSVHGSRPTNRILHDFLEAAA